MTKGIAGHHGDGRARRGSSPAGKSAAELASPRWWWNTATKIILGAGALATALAAVLSFWPSPDPADSASLSVVGLTRMPISEYQQRSASLEPARATAPSIKPIPDQPAVQVTIRLAGSSVSPATNSPIAGGSSTPPNTELLSPTEPSTSSKTEDPSESASPTHSPTPSKSPPSSSGPPKKPGKIGTAPPFDPSILTRELQRRAPELDLGCFSKKPPTCVILPALLPTAVAPNGATVPPAEAASRIVAVLKETRTGGKQPDGKVEPLGMKISVNIEAIGLRGQPLRLSWSVLQRSGDVPLPDAWLRTNSSYHLEATTDRDTGTVDFWVPIPKAEGQYFVSLVLTANGTALTVAESKDFG